MTEHYQVFLSYSRNDDEAASHLVSQLEKAGLSCFRDRDSIREGDAWLRKLQDAVDSCGSFVLLIGQDGVRRWMAAETEVALVRHIDPQSDDDRLPIVPILLGDRDPKTLIAFLRRFQLTRWNGTDELPQRLIRNIKDRVLTRNEEARLEGCPFVGLNAFQPDQATLFFGRKKETLDGLTTFDTRGYGQPIKWLEIRGNSGSGKSSLMNAGMLPLVEQGWLYGRTRYSEWRVIGPMMPGEHPLLGLAKQLAIAFSDPERGIQVEMADVRKRLETDGERALADWLGGRTREDTAFLLAIDQFEELFTFADAGEREVFDQLVATALADSDCPLFVLSTVRADFVDQYDRKLPHLQAALNRYGKSWSLPLIGGDALREVIAGPAALAGLDVGEVQEAMIAEAGHEPGALPLVENALQWLWEKREDGRLSGRLLTEQGGLAGILSHNADALLNSLGPRRRSALELLFALVNVDLDGLQHTRRRIPLEDTIEIVGGGAAGRELIDRLAGTQVRKGHRLEGPLRLITVADGYVNLIHETLIRAKDPDGKARPAPYWPTLWQYIDANKRRAALKERLRIAAREWQRTRALGRWLGLATWFDLPSLVGLKGLGELERKYRRWSLVSATVRAGILLVIAGILVEAYYWKATWDLPFEANLTRWAYRLGAELPLPELVRIPQNGVDRDSVADTKLPFYLGTTETTFEQYDYFCEATGRSRPLDYGWGRGQQPVINVDWNDAYAYTQWLSAMTGADCRLPSEAEWEYAARAGTGREYGVPAPEGSDDIAGKGLANCRGCGGQWDGEQVAPVGRFPPNPWGLYDMHGNVWEWCQNEYDDPERVGPGGEATRALRGGSWYYNPVNARASNRNWNFPDNRLNYIGIRVMCSSPIDR